MPSQPPPPCLPQLCSLHVEMLRGMSPKEGRKQLLEFCHLFLDKTAVRGTPPATPRPPPGPLLATPDTYRPPPATPDSQRPRLDSL